MEDNLNVEIDQVDQQQVIEEAKTYTQEDIDALQSQIDELIQYKSQEKTEQEKALEAQELKLAEKQVDLWQRHVQVELKSAGLEDFAEFVQVDVDDLVGLENKVKQLKQILGARELDGSFKPAGHRSADTYSVAEKQRDPVGMIGAKLSNLWK